MPATLRLSAGKKNRPSVMPGVEAGQAAEQKNPGGRPPKFDEPSRPITLTLPESTLDGLQKIDPDRGRAIVRLTETALRSGPQSGRQVELVKMAERTGLLIVGPSAALRRIPFLQLIEVAPFRYLLAMDPGHDFKALEIALHDVLEELPAGDKHERQMLDDLLGMIKSLRKDARVRMAEILIVQVESQKQS